MPPELTYDNIFRIIIMQFLDPYNFDVRSVKKSCIIVHPDGRIIPFDTFNLFYRDTAAARMPVPVASAPPLVTIGGMASVPASRVGQAFQPDDLVGQASSTWAA